LGIFPFHRLLGPQAYPVDGLHHTYHPFRHHGFVHSIAISSYIGTDNFSAGFAYNVLNASTSGRNAFVFLYCLTNFFQNFGPNTTTFVIPGEAFPTRYRSTGHGISAATGKLGAVISQVGFAQLVNIGGTNKFVQHM